MSHQCSHDPVISKQSMVFWSFFVLYFWVGQTVSQMPLLFSHPFFKKLDFIVGQWLQKKVPD
jgi:hypothetical protein